MAARLPDRLPSRFLAPRWNRSQAVPAAVVLWWINTGLALLCTILLPFYMFVRRQPQ